MQKWPKTAKMAKNTDISQSIPWFQENMINKVKSMILLKIWPTLNPKCFVQGFWILISGIDAVFVCPHIIKITRPFLTLRNFGKSGAKSESLKKNHWKCLETKFKIFTDDRWCQNTRSTRLFCWHHNYSLNIAHFSQ